ncbi:MAG: hypothetical protein PHT60_14100 [Acidiphilium sp.]|nr:hypothetical protein [Acidiphilium sp.]MDD4936898.1 hypothetical protein [Acidiphilium sp.]
MGWYYQPIGGRSTADKDRFLRGEIEQIADKPAKAGIKVIKSAFVGSTWYAAVQISIPDQTPYTVAYVYLTQMGRDSDFGYKPMDESVGPCEVDCPVGIMKLLTPIEQLPGVGYAADWRARVEAAREQKATLRQHRTRIASGTRIHFATPLRFTDGASYERFVAESLQWRGRTILVFVPIDSEGRWIGGRCRINRRVLATAEIETAEHATPATPTSLEKTAA